MITHAAAVILLVLLLITGEGKKFTFQNAAVVLNALTIYMISSLVCNPLVWAPDTCNYA